MRIRSVIPVARRRAFSVQTARGSSEFPWSELDVVPSAADPVVEAFSAAMGRSVELRVGDLATAGTAP